MSLLSTILERKRAELERLASVRLPEPPPKREISLSRGSGPLRLIAEIKRRSPSAGELSTRLSVAERARAYQRAGASAISVLCDREFFDGDFAHLGEARAASALPLLCKDFVIDELQLDLARAHGADWVLLIVRCLAPERVVELVAAARARGLEPLVEIVTHTEARVALDAGAELVGVNARDLDTLELDAARAADVLAALPDRIARIHLSGIATPEAVARIAASGADAALVGEALMRRDDPEPLLRELLAAAG